MRKGRLFFAINAIKLLMLIYRDATNAANHIT